MVGYSLWDHKGSDTTEWLTHINTIILGCKSHKEHNQSDFSIGYLVTSMCRVVSQVVGKGCLMWRVCSLVKTLLAFVLLHFVLQGQPCLFFQAALHFLLSYSNALWWKGHLSLMLVLEAVIEPVRFSSFGISGWGIDILFRYWMVCLGNEPRSSCHQGDCIETLHRGLFCWLWGLLPFF